MTSKEKAEDLFYKMLKNSVSTSDESALFRAKQNALIAVDEIIKECYNWNGSDNVQWETKRFDYWLEVKQEIEKL